MRFLTNFKFANRTHIKLRAFLVMFIFLVISLNGFSANIKTMKNIGTINKAFDGKPALRGAFNKALEGNPELVGLVGLLPESNLLRIAQSKSPDSTQMLKAIEQEIAVYKRALELNETQRVPVSDVDRSAFLKAWDTHAKGDQNGLVTAYESMAPPRADTFDPALAIKLADDADAAVIARLKDEGRFNSLSYEGSKSTVAQQLFSKNFDELKGHEKLAIVKTLELYREQGITDAALIAKHLEDNPTLHYLFKGDGKTADPDAFQGFAQLSKIHDQSAIKTYMGAASDGGAKVTAKEFNALVDLVSGKASGSLPDSHKKVLSDMKTEYATAYKNSQSRNPIVRAAARIKLAQLQRRVVQTESLHDMYASMKKAGAEEEARRLRDELCSCPGVAACPA